MNADNNLLPPEPPEPVEPVPQTIEPAALADPLHPEPASPQDEPPTPAKRPLPDDLRVPWGWADLVVLVGLAMVGIGVVSVAVMLALRLAGVSTVHIRKSPGAMSVIAIVAQAILDLGLLAYLAANIRLRFHAPFWRTIGWRPIETRSVSRTLPYFALALGGFSLAAIVAFAEALFPPKHALPIQSMTQNPEAALLFMLTAVLVAPVVEETIFRGFLYPWRRVALVSGWASCLRERFSACCTRGSCGAGGGRSRCW
jgi:membrane protease YdiL (CAAX protease family)